MNRIIAGTLAVLVSLSFLAGAALASPDMLSLVSGREQMDDASVLMRPLAANQSISLSNVRENIDQFPGIGTMLRIHVDDSQDLLRLQISNMTFNQTKLRTFDETQDLLRLRMFTMTLNQTRLRTFDDSVQDQLRLFERQRDFSRLFIPV